MFNSVALDVVIGLVFVYLLYSLLTTILMEILATWFSFRARWLKYAVSRMLDDDSGTNDVSELFYKHPLIKYLGEKKSRIKSKPAYINSSTFSKVFIDFMRSDGIKLGDNARSYIQDTLDTGKISWNGGTITLSDDTKKYLNGLWIDAQGDVSRFREKVENWFDETMDRAAGWYKKETQKWLFVIGFTIAVIFNVDTLNIVKKLQKDPKLREQMVQQADAFVKAHPNLEQEFLIAKKGNEEQVKAIPDSVEREKKQSDLDKEDLIAYENNKNLRNSLMSKADSLIKIDIAKTNGILGIGINTYDSEAENFGLSLIGWALTALALSLGAPFWFDLLNKLMKLRSSAGSASESKNSGDAKGQKAAPVEPKG